VSAFGGIFIPGWEVLVEVCHLRWNEFRFAKLIDFLLHEWHIDGGFEYHRDEELSVLQRIAAS
jgi:hypothetical protein